jgi:CxxC-x17-CxxC domain-containing protein
MSYADKTLTCRDCGAQFVFTAGEQEFYAQKGFTNEPSRCPNCRQARKTSGGSSRSGYGERGGGGYERGGGGYERGGGGYERGGGYGDRGGGSRSSGAREMYTAVCANCGREAKVPFVPSGRKPVLCDDCFQEQRRNRM